MKTLEDLSREQIDRLVARLEVRRIENDALREAVAAKEVELREWKALAVELGAFPVVERDKSRMTLDCRLKVDAGLLAQTKDRGGLLATLIHLKLYRPMVIECERMWGKQAATRETSE